jgi:hypothetical protein
MDSSLMICILWISLCALLHHCLFGPLHYRHLILNFLKTESKSFEEIQKMVRLLPLEAQELLEGMVQKCQVARTSRSPWNREGKNQNPILYSITPNGLRDLPFYARFDRD